MARLHIVIDVTADPSTRDPHEIAEDILGNGVALPTFARGVTFTLDDGDTGEGLGFEGTFVSAEWETP